MVDGCNKQFLVGVSFNGERLIVVGIAIVDYDQNLIGGKSYPHKTRRYKV